MIEISERKYWRQLNYGDGLLYCQLLEIDGKNDWRMIKNYEEWVDCRSYCRLDVDDGWGWYEEGNELRFLIGTGRVIPVRDVIIIGGYYD